MIIFTQLQHSLTHSVSASHYDARVRTQSIWMTMQAFVYMLASQRNGTLYTGVTSDLIARVEQHKQGLIPGFTNKYHVHRLVYYEKHADIREAIAAEKKLKRWKRSWKIRLTEKINPQWRDLYDDIRG